MPTVERRLEFRSVMMRLLFPLLGHLLVTLARLASPGGVRAVVAESLAVKHQLLIMKRSQRRAPNLTSWDRLMLGFYTLLVPSKRVRKMAVITKPSTLLRLHQALVKRKYHLLYGSNRPRRPGPKGPSSELIAAVVEMKRRNPRMGCRKIAEQISCLRPRDQQGCGPAYPHPELSTGTRL